MKSFSMLNAHIKQLIWKHTFRSFFLEPSFLNTFRTILVKMLGREFDIINLFYIYWFNALRLSQKFIIFFQDVIYIHVHIYAIDGQSVKMTFV